MTQQHTAAMRFVQGTSAPAPLADPLTEEEAVLVSDTQAAIQRLRDAVVATVGLHPLWTTCVLRSDLATLLDALDAATERVRALELAADQAGCAMVYAANRVHVEATRRPAKAVLERIGDELIDKRLELEERIGWQCGQQSAAWYIQRESATPRAADPDAT